MIPLMMSMNLPMKTGCPSLVGGWSYKYPARQSHMLRGTTPHCDVKTLRLGTRFHQRKEDNSRLGQTVVLFLYLPESGQSRCLSLSPLVVIG